MKWGERFVYLALVGLCAWVAYDSYNMSLSMASQSSDTAETATLCESQLGRVNTESEECTSMLELCDESYAADSRKWHQNQDHNCEKEQDDWNSCYYRSVFSRSIFTAHNACLDDLYACWSREDLLMEALERKH